ncbi:flagellar hook protein FlgE [Candidatus Symbiobacter mobilis]|uniref:Flagellar hook protein FlgE n=1 Tax=Candidatus Symbiobacter mobilis CR TaxID=946483 RepID=U5NB04_9BURK|nr:flagellar hook protein FlgE [Candidatus Symbiobacter mobilis]AGX87408.1 flagellar hook protein FlgE [Candidatus Symbiobacter mobilis CR]
MSFQTGLSGLTASSRSLDVIGHNIANVNTTGMKASRAEFHELVAASLGACKSINPGIGVSVATISQQFGQGSITSTGNNLDVAINGGGFFQVTQTDGSPAYTRDGSFKLDKEGFLITNSDANVMGLPTDATGKPTSATLQKLQLPTNSPIGAKQTTKIAAEFNLDARAKVATDIVPYPPITTYGTSLVAYDSQGVEIPVTLNFVKTSANTWDVYDSTTLATGAQALATNAAITQTNAANAELHTKNTALNATNDALDVTNTTLNAPNDTLDATNTELNAATDALDAENTTWNTENPTETPRPTYASGGLTRLPTYATGGLTRHPTYASGGLTRLPTYDVTGLNPAEEKIPAAAELVPTGATLQLTFDANGKLVTPKENVELTLTSLNPAVGENGEFTVELDLSKATQYGTSFAVSDLTQDGYTAGDLTGLSVGEDGVINARYSNGQTQSVGKIALADFRNVQGLMPAGGNAWVSTMLSGPPVQGMPSVGKFGGLRPGALEDSNVDLTSELVNMMTAQRAYQANAQTIKTQDQVMSTLVNLR